MASASTCVSSSSSKASNSSSCSTNKKEEGTTSSSSTKPVNPPEIVKYAYKEFVVDRAENKWKAKCCACRDFITETRGVTTGFSRYFVIHVNL